MKKLIDMTEPEIERYLDLLCDAVEGLMPGADNPRGRTLFAVVLFDMPGLGRYVSTANRGDLLKAILEMADQLEAADGS
jgi:hypothetical protein